MKAPVGYSLSSLAGDSLPAVQPSTWLRSQKYTAEAFTAADRHAIEVSQVNHASFKDLLYALVHSAHWTPLETLRVIFRWMTAKDMFGIEFSNEHLGLQEEILLGFKKQKSTYGSIFELLCMHSGLPCVTVTGYAKGTQFRPGHKFGNRSPNHSWNVVYVEGSWQLVDCHWATRFLKATETGEGESMIYEYDDFYFCTDPRQLIYSHFPTDAKWQLLSRPLSQDEFEDLPVAKSHFFEFGMSFLSHHSAVISTSAEGGLAMSFGNPHPMVFSFLLVPSGERTEADVLKRGSEELVRCCMQETKPAQVNYFLLPPRQGAYYFTVYASTQAPDENVVIERMYHAVCEYKVIAQAAVTSYPLLPPAADGNWGPGPVLYQSGLLPHHQEAVVKATAEGHAEVGFDKVKPEVRLLARVRHDQLSPQECERCVKLLPPNGSADGDGKLRIVLDLPQLGRYTLEVYVNNPATDGNTFVHVCQYLIVVSDDKTNEPAVSGSNAAFLQGTDFIDCYDYDGHKATLPIVSSETEQLARRLSGAVMTPPKVSTAAGLSAAVAVLKKVPQLQTQLANAAPGIKASASVWTPGSVSVGAQAASAFPAPKSSSLASEDIIVPSLQAAKVQSAPLAADGTVVVGGPSATVQFATTASENAPKFGASLVARPLAADVAVGVASPQVSVQLSSGLPAAQLSAARPAGGGLAARINAFNSGTVAPTDEGVSGTIEGAPKASAAFGIHASGPQGGSTALVSGVTSQPSGVIVEESVVPLATRSQAAAPSAAGGAALSTSVPSVHPSSAIVVESILPDTARAQAWAPVSGQGNVSVAAKSPTTPTATATITSGQISVDAAAVKSPATPLAAAAVETSAPGALAAQASVSSQPAVAGSSKSKPSTSFIGGALVAGASKLQASAFLTATATPSAGSSATAATASVEAEASFPAPPPASQLLTIDFAPARDKSEVPVAPKDFVPVKMVTTPTSEPVPIPEPLSEVEAEKMSFSVRRAQQFKTLDAHAVQVSSTEHNSFKDLIWDLIYSKSITDELEIARVIFLWLCTKDLSKIKFDKVTPGSPEEILQGLKDSKATYAKIYDILCSYAGLHSTVVTGYAKGVDYKPGMSFKGSTAFHSWNAVRIHGHYRLVDCHWASRRIVGKKGQENIRYELDDYYFLVDPRQLIFTHYPEEERWQLLKKTYSLSEYDDLPPVKSLFFRYNLQLTSHLHAVIRCRDELTIELNYQRYVGPGLDFTFSLQTDDGKEVVDGVKLNRFGLHWITPDQFAFFRLRAPSKNEAYRLTIFAREARTDNAAAGKTYSAVVEYKVACEGKAAMKPYPNCLAASWGLSAAAAKAAGIVPQPGQLSAVLNTSNGECQVSFSITRPLLFACHLKGGPKEAELPGATICRVFGDSSAAVFAVSAPGKGEYGLEIFVNDPSCDGKTLRHLCQYLVVCDEKRVSGVVYPSLPTAYLGPQQTAFADLGLATLPSSVDPLVVAGESGEIEIEFAVSRPIRATASLASVGDERELDDNVLQLLQDGVLSFRVRPPAAGLYKLQVFAQPLDDVSDSLPGVYNCLMRVAALPKRPLTAFPRQFSAWKEGCYLFEPVDGNLASVYGKSRPSHVPFRVKVPLASKVAVVAGSEWTHLEPIAPGSDVFAGKANMEAGWGVESTAALTASYGADSGSYNTLLEYSI